MKKYLAVLFSVMMFFSSVGVAAAAFKDVSQTHWAVDEITYLTENKVIGGYSDGSFRPQEQLTRIQAIILMAKALKLDLSNRPNPGFKDVPPSHASYKYVAAVMDAGVFPKKSNYLEPYKPITRDDMAYMLAKGFELKASGNYSFKDVSSNHWAYPSIMALASNNITIGYGDGTFRPNAVVTRAQFSTFLAKAKDDQFKTFTYHSQMLAYKMQLPNYMKDKITVKDKKVQDYVYVTEIYYKDTTNLKKDLFVGAIRKIHKSKMPQYQGAPYNPLKIKGDYHYFHQGPSESPYSMNGQLNSPEAIEFSKIYFKIFHMSKGIQ
ncbi:S-layer homology domain-containing protein [Bacillus sp. REN10]|uniref:S-layer homology domain-containing protein n=1 Tax=Bacillus sp. REN10 TaxID=2782541 RepID=UPI00193B2387|nr:S-layer homology domain-containing protein [Bacillus sp. REN10]